MLLSALLHFLLVEQSGWVGLAKFPGTLQSSLLTIDAELEATPAKAAVVNNPQIAPEPPAKEVPTAMTDVPAPEATEPEVPVNETTVAESSLPEPALPQQVAETTESAPAEQVLTVPDTTTEATKPTPFTMVETDFDVLMNHSLERVGTAKIRYAKGNDHTYELTWSVSATGLIGLVYPDLLQTSQGKVTEAGLLPDFYLYKFGAREDKSYQASFHWADKEVALQSTKGTKKVAMAGDAPAGHIQDFLSFMYQFMFAPPLEDMQMYLTNGRKLGLYQYAFEGEETLELKFANVKTYHIQHAKADSDDKTELWLAMDYQYVPVKIRKTEKDGTVIEQVATKLKFETIENETPLP